MSTCTDIEQLAPETDDFPMPDDHVVIDPSILYLGTPVLLISTSNVDGSANLAPISSSWFLGTVGVLGIGTLGHTIQNLRRTGEAVLNFPSVDLVDAVTAWRPRPAAIRCRRTRGRWASSPSRTSSLAPA